MRIASSPAPTPIAGSVTVQAQRADTPAAAPELPLPLPKGEAQSPPLTINVGDKRIELNPDELTKVVDKLNDTAQIFNYTLRFQMGEGFRINVKVVDTNSGRIVREIPPEGIMETFARMQDVIGVLLDAKV